MIEDVEKEEKMHKIPAKIKLVFSGFMVRGCYD